MQEKPPCPPHRMTKIILPGNPEFDHYKCGFCFQKFRDPEGLVPFEIKVINACN